MYKIINPSGEEVLNTSTEMVIAAFLNGVLHGGSEIVDYIVTKNGTPIIKTLLLNKYTKER